MKATQELRNLGQSLWLDNITRDLLDNGTLTRRTRPGHRGATISAPSPVHSLTPSGCIAGSGQFGAKLGQLKGIWRWRIIGVNP